jgi:hypothetical protein
MCIANPPISAGEQKHRRAEQPGYAFRILHRSSSQAYYGDGLAIRVRLAEADPSNSEAQRDLSVSYERLGDLMQAVGNTGEAERFYRGGLAIAESAPGRDAQLIEWIQAKLRELRDQDDG